MPPAKKSFDFLKGQSKKHVPLADSSRRVSMRDIARASGFSISAVSLAIQNSSRVSATARLQIQQKAREMGYRPDPILSALCHYRRAKGKFPISAELAWVNGWPNPQKLRSFLELDLYWQGAFEEASKNGFRLEDFWLKECKTAAHFEHILRTRNIRGILIPPHGTIQIDWAGFNWDDFCVVRFGHSVLTPRAHLVTSDQVTDGMIAFENMWNQGYRRIAFVAARSSVTKNTRFSAGFFQGQLKAGLRSHLQPLLLEDEFGTQNVQKQLSAWLRQFKPDAIFTEISHLHAMLVKCGYRVPQDIGLAVTSVLDGNGSAGIDQNSKAIGKAAVQLLTSLVNHNECGIPKICHELLVEGRWINGDTLPIKAHFSRKSLSG